MLPRGSRMDKTAMQSRPFLQRKFSFGTIKFFKTKTSRAGVVVSKKIYTSAVQRNRLRRRVYTAIREFLLTHKPQYGIVVYPTKEALTAKFSEVKESLNSALTNESVR